VYNPLQKMSELKLSRPLQASNDDTQYIYLVLCVCTSTVHLHTTFHMPVSNVLWITVIPMMERLNICTAAILVYILQKMSP